MTRVAIGSLMQETNTFVPFPTTLRTFEAFYLHRGEEMLSRYGAARVEVPAFLSVVAASLDKNAPTMPAPPRASGCGR